jgi:hypothetical protein
MRQTGIAKSIVTCPGVGNRPDDVTRQYRRRPRGRLCAESAMSFLTVYECAPALAEAGTYARLRASDISAATDAATPAPAGPAGPREPRPRSPRARAGVDAGALRSVFRHIYYGPRNS